jgi:hypothetical protein
MIPVGQPYRAVGSFNLRSIVSTLILGVTAAVVAALAVWAWESSPIPTFIFFTPMIQGCLIGLVLAFAIGRLHLRNVGLLTLMGFVCGFSSAAMVHFSHHLTFAGEYVAEMKARVPHVETLLPQEKAQILETLDKEPNKVVDDFLIKKTGYPGPIGSLILRNQLGVEIKNSKVTGWGLWILWGGEALMVAVFAAFMAEQRARMPFCEDCHEWCSQAPAGVFLPGEAAGELSAAVLSDDGLAIQTLLKNPPETSGKSFAGSTLHTCPACDQTFADVWLRTDKTKGNKTESKIKNLVQRVRVSPEMTARLRNWPVPPSELEEEIEDAPPAAE